MFFYWNPLEVATAPVVDEAILAPHEDEREIERKVVLPPELMCQILNHLPSKKLARLRSTSSVQSHLLHLYFTEEWLCFDRKMTAEVVNHLLRCRLMETTNDDDYELLLESCPPFATRSTHRQAIQFNSFTPLTFEPSHISSSSQNQLATFVPVAEVPIPQFLALDDDQYFGNEMASLQLRAKTKPVVVESTEVVDTTADQSIRALTPFNSRRLPNMNPIISLSGGVTRLFRHHFEVSTLDQEISIDEDAVDDASPSSSYTSTTSILSDTSTNSSTSSTSTDSQSKSKPRSQIEQILIPTNPSALLSASISCYTVPPPKRSTSNSPSTSSSTSSTPSSFPGISFTSSSSPQSFGPKLFEWYYKSLRIDVARFVVGVEEGMAGGGNFYLYT